MNMLRVKLAIWVVLLASALSFVYLISTHIDYRFDLTQKKQFSLSKTTRDILKTVTQNIQITCFYKQNAFDQEMLELLLKEYASHNAHIQYRFVDPDRQPGLAQRYGIRHYGAVVVESGPNKEMISPESLFLIGADGHAEHFNGEQAITSAISRLFSDVHPVVYFTQGHTEKLLNGDEADGLSVLESLLKQNGYIAKPLDLATKVRVPKDASAVIIVGPKQEFSSLEMIVLKDYLSRGGRIIVLLDPFGASLQEGFLSVWNVQVGQDVVIDPSASTFFDPSNVVPELSAHPISASLRAMQLSVVMPAARSIVKTRYNPKLQIATLLSTSASSWSKKSIEGQTVEFDPAVDERGPFNVAVLVQDPSLKPGTTSIASLLVMGDSDFIANHSINLQGNQDFILNCIGYLTDQGLSLSIRPSAFSHSNELLITNSRFQLIAVLIATVIPSLILIVAMVVWWRRRGL